MNKLPGEILRLKREQKNLSIDEISHNIKISKRILKKIENSNFKGMNFFQKKFFIKNYAKFLGIDDEFEIYEERSLQIKEETFIEGNSKTTIIDYLFPKIIIPTLIAIIAIIIFYGYETDRNNYLQKLTTIDNKISGNLYEGVDDNPPINELVVENGELMESKLEAVPSQKVFVEEIPSEILFLSFNDEVWIQVEHEKEILVSRVFQKNDEISLEVKKEDNIYITSGNLGLITIKTNYSEEKELGLDGEIGRKKIF